MKSALTSAGLGIVGDCVAQTLQRKPWEKKEVETKKKNSQLMMMTQIGCEYEISMLMVKTGYMRVDMKQAMETES